jgi:hypothetical protein
MSTFAISWISEYHTCALKSYNAITYCAAGAAFGLGLSGGGGGGALLVDATEAAFITPEDPAE